MALHTVCANSFYCSTPTKLTHGNTIRLFGRWARWTSCTPVVRFVIAVPGGSLSFHTRASLCVCCREQRSVRLLLVERSVAWTSLGWSEPESPRTSSCSARLVYAAMVAGRCIRRSRSLCVRFSAPAHFPTIAAAVVALCSGVGVLYALFLVLIAWNALDVCQHVRLSRASGRAALSTVSFFSGCG